MTHAQLELLFLGAIAASQLIVAICSIMTMQAIGRQERAADNDPGPGGPDSFTDKQGNYWVRTSAGWELTEKPLLTDKPSPRTEERILAMKRGYASAASSEQVAGDCVGHDPTSGACHHHPAVHAGHCLVCGCTRYVPPAQPIGQKKA